MSIKHSLQVGLGFGLTSGVITTVGLMVGLQAGTQSKLVVVGGILTIAVADAFSDALGIHIAEESENVHTTKEIWWSTISTFLAKAIVALTFIIPVLLLDLRTAIILSIMWGFFLLSLYSYFMAKDQNIKCWKIIFEHVFVATLVIIISHFIGKWIGKVFQ